MLGAGVLVPASVGGRFGFGRFILMSNRVADCARERTAAYLVLQAAAPWSPATHAVRSTATRARAVELVRVGRLLSTSDTSLTPGIRAWLGSPAGRTFWLRVIAAVI